jgi:hypothetical protein
MINFIIFTIGSVGITIIITLSYITEPFRLLFAKNEALYHFVRCYQCIGFWVGLITGIVFVSTCGYPIYYTSLIAIYYAGMISVLSYLVGSIIKRLWR